MLGMERYNLTATCTRGGDQRNDLGASKQKVKIQCRTKLAADLLQYAWCRSDEVEVQPAQLVFQWQVEVNESGLYTMH